MFENPRRGRQARNFTTNAPKILDLKSSSEQIFSRKLPLGAPAFKHYRIIIGSHVKTVTTLSLVSLTAVVNVITQRHLKQLQGRLLDPWSSFTLKSNNNFN